MRLIGASSSNKLDTGGRSGRYHREKPTMFMRVIPVVAGLAVLTAAQMARAASPDYYAAVAGEAAVARTAQPGPAPGLAPSLAYEKGMAAYAEDDYTTALRLWQPLAEQGKASAQFALGLLHDNGLGVTMDRVQAAEWYRRAAEQGFVRAQFNLGVLYSGDKDGGRSGVAQDNVEAVKWYRLAAEKGNAKAQFNLGLCYIKGTGVPKSGGEAARWAEAATWLQRAAAQGHLKAQHTLGLLQAKMNPEGQSRN